MLVTYGSTAFSKYPRYRSGSGKDSPGGGFDSMEDPSKRAFAMKPALIDAIQEVINELETVYENVAKNAREYIHAE